MSSTPLFPFITILLTSWQLLITAQNTPLVCQSLYITIPDFGENSINIHNWTGVYSIDDTQTSYNTSIWHIPSTNKWLKYIETHWVLSGANNQLLIYESNSLFPPTNQTTFWTHEFHSDTAQVHLQCSHSLSPTASPTPAPTANPTYSPTISNCDILMLSDANTDSYFNNWKYTRLSINDDRNRPIWQHTHDSTESFVQFLNIDGWIVFLNDGTHITTYATQNLLFGNFPTLNTPIPFNLTTNHGLARIFTFVCYSTDIPTYSPSTAPSTPPTIAPLTLSPTHAPNYSPSTESPMAQPTIAPSLECEALKIDFPNALFRINSECGIDFEEVFDSVWLKQVSRSDRPSWALDCNDGNTEYIRACMDGYSGTVFFISQQWEIQIHSKNHDCFERFVVENTNSFFVPNGESWIDQSTLNSYVFTIECMARVYAPTPQMTADTFRTQNTVYTLDSAWFWIAFALIVLIAALVCFAVYYWKKQRGNGNMPRGQPKAMKVKSMSSVQSRQSLELQKSPKQAYLDQDIAPINNEKTVCDGNVKGTTTVNDPNIMSETDVKSEGIQSTANDPNMNPNLKKNNANLGTRGHPLNGEMKSVSDNDIEELYNNDMLKNVNRKETDQALEIIAGGREATGYAGNENNEEEMDSNDYEFNFGKEVFNV